MLDFLTSLPNRMCDRLSRRDLLRVGGFGLGGLALTDLLRLKAQARSEHYVKDKSVVLLFLAGGPSQLETFDPKPDGPDTSTSIAGHIATALPGVRFASYFPKLAKLADRLSIVRSFQVQHAEHNGAHKQLLTADLSIQDGKPIKEPGLGAILSRVAGPIHPRTGMPRHALVPPNTRYLGSNAGFAGAFESVVEGSQPAFLGPGCAPFEVHVPMAAGNARASKKKVEATPSIIDDLQPVVPGSVLSQRLDLLRQFDQLDRRIDHHEAIAGMDQHARQALDLLRGGGVRAALDLSREDPRTLAAYDTEHFRNWNCSKDSKFERQGPSIGISLGRQLLMARRLCEAGCGFVTLIHANWDFHARPGIPNIPEGMGVLAPPVDHAVAAFLQDIEQRGLSDKILLVITGEFGRTPKLDAKLGRHHWPRICPLVFAGGGLQHGQVIGRSDRRGGEPASNPITIDDFHATILNYLFDTGEMRLDTAIPRRIQERAEKGRPIAELF